MKRFVLIASGLFVAFAATACSATRTTIAGAPCEDSPAAATLMYPRPDARNVSTSLSEIVLSGSERNPSAKVSLIDAGGQQIVIGPLKRTDRPADAPPGLSYEAAAVKPLAPQMNYVVLYTPLSCAGSTDYAIGSFTTE